MTIERNIYLKRLIAREHNGMIKIITGIRRCGKSFLLNTIFYNYLRAKGVPADHIIAFAFDSFEDLAKIGEHFSVVGTQKVNPEKFINFVNSQIVDGNDYYLLLDEVQNLGNFELVLNSFLYRKNLDVYVTGSNSKFLSKDVITEFRGRGDEIHMFPLNFSEFLSVFSGTKDEAFAQYLLYGGLPQIAQLPSEEQKISYLKTQISTLYLRDIVQRHSLRGEKNLADLFNVLASNIASLVNPPKLAAAFKTLKNAALSVITIDNYIEFMEDSFILKRVFRYDLKGKKYIGTPYKIYFEDIGLRNAQLDFRQVEETHALENIVYNELRSRGFNVDVGIVPVSEKIDGKDTKKQLEIDFVANRGSARFYIQVAYEIPTLEKWQQETRVFSKIPDAFRRILIVAKTATPRNDERGCLIVGIKEFLLNPELMN